MAMSNRVWVAVAFVVGMTTAAAGAISVPLTVAERAGVARTGEIAAGGVPMPRGAVKDTSSFAVVDGTGTPVPAQFTVLNRWPSDGSVRWMLVEFPVTLEAKKTATFTLKQGVKNPKHPNALVVTEDDGKITIKCGSQQVNYPKNGVVDAPIVVETVSGETYAVGNDEGATATLEEAGPLRATVRFDGHHKSRKGEPLFAFRIRVSMYAGLRVARVQYVFTHDQGGFSNTPVAVKSISWTVVQQAFKGPVTACVGGTGKDHVAPLKRGETLRQLFKTSATYTLSGALEGSGQAKSSKDPNLGWCSLRNEQGGVTAAVRWCWQLYPKAFSLSGDGTLKIELVPPDAREPLYIYRGMSKTHDILIAERASADVQAAAKAFQQPLFVKCPTAWYCEDTLGFGRLLSVGSKHLRAEFLAFDRKVADGFEQQIRVIRDWRGRIVDRRRQVDSYGMIHFGDGFHHRTGSGHRAIEWDNCYYSYTHLLAMQYARSGSNTILDTLREAATFEGDIGIGWVSTDIAGPRQNPGRYHVGGFGTFNNHNSGSWSFYKPIGIMEAFYLTGDRRHQDAALANFNWTLRSDGYDIYNNPRSVGAGLRACIHGYLATGNSEFLSIARDVARKAERFYRTHGHFAPVRNSIFMCPNALSGLCTYHEFTGDAHLGKVLPAIVKAHFDRFGRRPGRTDYAYMNLYASRFAGDAALQERVEGALASETRFGIQRGEHHIKDFAAGKRDVPLISWYLSDLATTPPKPWGMVDVGPDRPDRADVGTMNAPTLDGTLAPGEWDKAAVIDLVSNPVVSRKPKAPTRLRLGYDAKNLYLAVGATEPRLDLLKLDVKEDGGPTYSDDCIEIFVGPNARRFNVKLMVNAAGIRLTSLRGHYRREHPKPPEADFPVAAGRARDAWVLEVTIPWTAVGINEVKPGTEVAFNVVRYRVGRGTEKPGEASTWHGTSNQIESVGTLVLAE